MLLERDAGDTPKLYWRYVMWPSSMNLEIHVYVVDLISIGCIVYLIVSLCICWKIKVHTTRGFYSCGR